MLLEAPDKIYLALQRNPPSVYTGNPTKLRDELYDAEPCTGILKGHPSTTECTIVLFLFYIQTK